MSIERLTVEQSQLLRETCFEWHKTSSSHTEIDKIKFESSINWIYSNLLNKGNPKIIYCDSWLSCSLLITSMTQKFRSFGSEVGVLAEIETRMRDVIHEVIRNPNKNTVISQSSPIVRNIVQSQVSELVGEGTKGSIDDFELETNHNNGWDAFYSNANVRQTDTIVVDKFKNHLINSISTFNFDTHPFQFIRESMINNAKDYDISLSSSFGSIKNNYLLSANKGLQFCAYYDFFEKLGVPTNHAFKVYKHLIKSGVFQVFEFDSIVFAIQPPVNINRNSEGQLHSTERPAIEFRDSSAYYFINGRSMPKRIFLNDFDKNDFITEANEDIKAGMMRIITERKGSHGLLDFLGAELIDQKEINHFEGYKEIISLYKTKETYPFLQDRLGNRNQPYCWSGFKCPSTGTDYLIDNSSDFVCALEAMKFLRPTFVPEELTYQWIHSAN